MLASVVHLLWFLRYLLKSLPIVLGFQVELFLVGTAVWSWLSRLMPGRCNVFDISLIGLAVTVFFRKRGACSEASTPGRTEYSFRQLYYAF
jgi:hypothetical protein